MAKSGVITYFAKGIWKILTFAWSTIKKLFSWTRGGLNKIWNFFVATDAAPVMNGNQLNKGITSVALPTTTETFQQLKQQIQEVHPDIDLPDPTKGKLTPWAALPSLTTLSGNQKMELEQDVETELVQLIMNKYNWGNDGLWEVKQVISVERNISGSFPLYIVKLLISSPIEKKIKYLTVTVSNIHNAPDYNLNITESR